MLKIPPVNPFDPGQISISDRIRSCGERAVLEIDDKQFLELDCVEQRIVANLCEHTGDRQACRKDGLNSPKRAPFYIRAAQLRDLI